MTPMILLSLALGFVASLTVPAVLIVLGQPSLGATVWGSLFGFYLSVAELVDPIVWVIVPWPMLFPEGGAPGAFALMLADILVSWGLLFTVASFLLLRARLRRSDL
jgi:hypothetical protein